MEKELDKIKKEIKEFCEKYNCTLGVETTYFSITGTGQKVGFKIETEVRY